MNHSGLLIQVHSHLVKSYACLEGIWQSPFVIINHQTGNGVGVWVTSCPEEMVLRIWAFEKILVEIRPLKGQLGFLTLRRTVGFFGSRPAEMNWDLKHHKMHCTLGWDQHIMVSICFNNCVSLLVLPWTEARN